MPKKKSSARKGSKAKTRAAGEEYECEVCGTTFFASKKGVECMEDVVCCGKPMKLVSASKAKPRARKAAKKPAKKKR